MATFFGGEAKDFVLRVGLSKKPDSILNTSWGQIFVHKTTKIRFQ